MFNNFQRVYEIFKAHDLNNPLLETLRLVDLLSGGTLREMDLALFKPHNLDLSYVAGKRKEEMPLEYILGQATFMGLTLYCSPDTLIPREETELLVKVALRFIEKRQEIKDTLTIIDMGTGCGNIAISLARNTQNTQILASDISASAIDIARKNVEKFNLERRISLFCGDLFSPFRGMGYEEKIDMVVCNPPYIPTGTLKKLSNEIIDHEPIVALDAGPYGIDFYRKLITNAISFLKPEGILVFEIGAGQEKVVTRLFERNGGYENIRYFADNSGQTRVLSGVKK